MLKFTFLVKGVEKTSLFHSDQSSEKNCQQVGEETRWWHPAFPFLKECFFWSLFPENSDWLLDVRWKIGVLWTPFIYMKHIVRSKSFSNNKFVLLSLIRGRESRKKNIEHPCVPFIKNYISNRNLFSGPMVIHYLTKN